MTSKKSKTSKPHVLIRTDLRRGGKGIVLSNDSIYYIWKNIKKNHTTIANLKYQLLLGMISLNYQMDHILHQIFKTSLITF